MNAQLEKAIQEAMGELDRIPTTTHKSNELADTSQSRNTSISSTLPVKNTRARVTRATTKLIKIAPAPPSNSKKPIPWWMKKMNVPNFGTGVREIKKKTQKRNKNKKIIDVINVAAQK